MQSWNGNERPFNTSGRPMAWAMAGCSSRITTKPISKAAITDPVVPRRVNSAVKYTPRIPA